MMALVAETSARVSLTYSKGKKMNDEQVLIQAVRVVANDRYEQGWSVIVESWTDGDILEVLSECQFDLFKTVEELQSYVDAYLQKQEDISY
jgi:hypothetical protein